MKKEDVHIDDWQRLLFGYAPMEFMLKVLLRTIFIYLMLLLVLRLLGKRMTAQASILELSVMITLGAIVALPMQDPDTGLLPGLLILFSVLGLQRLSNWWSVKDQRVDELLQGTPIMLVCDGQLQIDTMRRAAISHEQLFAQLRQQGLRSLGQVQRMYMEANGLFSIFPFDEPVPGLSIIPAADATLVHDAPAVILHWACKNCGHVLDDPSHLDPCERCRVQDWIPAISPHSIP